MNIKEQEHKIDKMFTYAKGFFHGANMKQSLEALTYMRARHTGQTRSSGERYIIHPLRMACNAMALGIDNDDLMATILIHDVVEDTHVAVDDLPFNDSVRRSVKYMTVTKFDGELKSVTKNRYYHNLLEDANALICKGFDRQDNLSTITDLEEKAIVKNILETNILLLPKMKEAKEKWPSLSNILHTLRTNIKNMNDILASCYKVNQEDEELLYKILDDPDFKYRDSRPNTEFGPNPITGFNPNSVARSETNDETDWCAEFCASLIEDSDSDSGLSSENDQGPTDISVSEWLKTNSIEDLPRSIQKIIENCSKGEESDIFSDEEISSLRTALENYVPPHKPLQ